jgi:hypothetical protein
MAKSHRWQGIVGIDREQIVADVLRMSNEKLFFLSCVL